MTLRARKLVGSLTLVGFSVLYFWLAVTIALMRLPGTPTTVHIGFYALATFLWFLPCALLIRWMQRP